MVKKSDSKGLLKVKVNYLLVAFSYVKGTSYALDVHLHARVKGAVTIYTYSVMDKRYSVDCINDV